MKKQIKSTEIYIDAEWFISQKMYLLGYAYDLRNYGQLYGRPLNRANVIKLLKNVTTIYFWGPDIGMLEKCFNINLREQYCCVNLLKAMRILEPRAKCYKLAHFEKLAGFQRKTMEYKGNIWNLHRDWKDPKHRERALLYNREDVLYMLRVKRYFFRKHGVTQSHLVAFCL